MSDAPADGPDPLRAWLEATRGEHGDTPEFRTQAQDRPATGPSRRLLVATAVVCATAVVLGGAAVRRGDGAPSPSGTPPAAPSPAIAGLPTAAPAPTATPGLTAPAPHPGNGSPAPASIDAALAAAAVVAVRTGAADDLYVDTAAAESATPAGSATLITVRTVLLRRVQGGWSGPEFARFAVPVARFDGTAVALATPWRLLADDPQAPGYSWRVFRDRDAQQRATSALTAAGYTSPTRLRLRYSQEVPEVLAARVRAVAPGDEEVAEHELWLTRDGAAVLGQPAMNDLPVGGDK